MDVPRRSSHWRTGLVLVVGLVVFAVFWIVKRRPEAMPLGVAAIDADEAIVMLEASGEDHPSQYWITRLGAGEGVRWRAGLSAAAFELVPRHGMTIGDGLVTVREHAHDETSVHIEAFALEDGKRAWNSDPLPFDIDKGTMLAFAPVWFRSIAVDGVLYEPHHDGHQLTLYAFDRASGEPRWLAPLPDHFGDPRPLDRWLLVHDRASWIALDRGDGRRGGALPTTALCPIDDALVGVSDAKLVSWRASDLELLDTDGPRIAPWPDTEVSWCATHAGRVVFAIGGIGDPFGLAAVDIDSWRVAWTLGLDGTRAISETSEASPGAGPTWGELHRYRPYMIVRQEVAWLAIVDHVEGELVRTERLGSSTDWRRSLRTRSGTIVTDKTTLVFVDGATGRITARLRADTPLQDPGEAAVFGDTTWLVGRTRAGLGDVAWTRLLGSTIDERGALDIASMDIESIDG